MADVTLAAVSPSGTITTPTASTAVPTDGAYEAVDGLEATEGHLHQTHDQQHGKEGQVPRHNVIGLLTLAPQIMVCQVISLFKWI